MYHPINSAGQRPIKTRIDRFSPETKGVFPADYKTQLTAQEYAEILKDPIKFREFKRLQREELAIKNKHAGFSATLTRDNLRRFEEEYLEIKTAQVLRNRRFSEKSMLSNATSIADLALNYILLRLDPSDATKSKQEKLDSDLKKLSKEDQNTFGLIFDVMKQNIPSYETYLTAAPDVEIILWRGLNGEQLDKLRSGTTSGGTPNFNASPPNDTEKKTRAGKPSSESAKNTTEFTFNPGITSGYSRHDTFGFEHLSDRAKEKYLVIVKIQKKYLNVNPDRDSFMRGAEQGAFVHDDAPIKIVAIIEKP